MSIIDTKINTKLATVEKLAIELIHKHLPNKGWQFAWQAKTQALGTCDYRKKTILLSKNWSIACSIEDITDTILHEIAHALTPGAAHGRLWKIACVQIGATPERLANVGISTSDIHTPTHRMIDTTTGKTIREYYRKPNANTYRKIKNYYVIGRKQETVGKLEIVETSLLEQL